MEPILNNEGLKPYPAYKDSGVPWLGDVPEHWDVVTLRRQFDRYDGIKIGPFGSQLKLEHMTQSGYKVYGQANVIANDFVRGSKFVNEAKYRELSACEILPGDLLLTMMGSSGRCALVPDNVTPGIMDSHLLRLRLDDSRVSGQFAALVIDQAPYVKDQINIMGKGSIMQGLNSAMVKNLTLTYPSPDEQCVIVKYLNYVDRRVRRYIRAKQKLIKLLEEQKQAIIHQAVTRGLDPHAPLKPSGIDWLGDIPSHWNIISVGAATSLLQTGPFGSQLHSYEYVTGGTPVINPSHMKDGRIVPDSTVSVSTLKLRELERHRMCVGDIVAARRGELGRCALVTLVEEGWLCGTGSLLLRCKPSILVPAYFQIVFASQGIHDSLSLASVGATMDNLNTGMVARLQMPLPPYAEQIRIIEKIESEKKRCAMAISNIYGEIALLREYRTRLIADVVIGKLDVRTIAASLPDETDEPDTLDDADTLTDEDDLSDDTTPNEDEA